MEQSESINELAKALNKVQTEALFALKDSTNPFFKSKYADLSSVWEVARGPLTENGLAVAQTMSQSDVGEPIIITTLMHVSGQWIRGFLTVKPVKPDPQSLGSAITYGRRYSLSAILGICPDDDDAEKGMGRSDKRPKKQPKKQPKPEPKPSVKETGPLNKAQGDKILLLGGNKGLSDEETMKVIDWYAENNEHGGRSFEAGQALLHGFDTIFERFMDAREVEQGG